jgi:tryptophan aminotransferase
MTSTLERRKEVLRLAREHNFLILEGRHISFLFSEVDRLTTLYIDDPYYYLYFGKTARPPSYFKLELDEPEVGRVIRFDSFSKILSAGMRMGFASGPKPIIDVMDVHVCTRYI